MIEALKATEMAQQHPVSIKSLVDLNQDQKDLVKKRCEGDNIVIYSLPGGNVCVPTLSEDDRDECLLTHVMHGKVGHFRLLLLLKLSSAANY
jgi:hypothetical protein